MLELPALVRAPAYVEAAITFSARVIAAVFLVSLLGAATSLASSTAVPDGFGGFYAAWDEARNESDVFPTREVFVQHFTVAGAVSPGWPAYGLPVSASAPNQDTPLITSGSSGGSIVVWMDYSGGRRMPRAQSVSSAGARLWGATGVALTAGDSYRMFPSAIPDGAGGVIAAWTEYVSGQFGDTRIVLQRLTAAGAVAAGWPAAGLQLPTNPGQFSDTQLFPDGANGAIVVWTLGVRFGQRVSDAGVLLWSPANGMDLGFGSTTFGPKIDSDGAGGLVAANLTLDANFVWTLSAFRSDGNGAALWGASGIPVATSAGQIYPFALARDGTGGAVVCWTAAGGSFAQRLGSTGAVATGWAANGVPITGVAPSLVVGDGSGGAYFIGSQSTVPPPAHLGSQHLAADGSRAPGWPVDGVAVVTTAITLSTGLANVTLLSDGNAGEIVAWHDNRMGLLGHDYSAQRIDPTGARQWTDDGLVIATESNNQRGPVLVPANAGGAIALWRDKRSGGWDIYGRQVDAAGAPVGPTHPICTAADDQYLLSAASDGLGGAVAAWGDWRNGVQGVEAQRLTVAGSATWTPDGVALMQGLGGQVPFGLAGDGAGGAYVGWPTPSFPRELSVQHLDSGGSPLWGATGMSPIALGSSVEDNWVDALPDGAGGVIFVWKGFGFDTGSGFFTYELHAQRLTSDGTRTWGPDGAILARPSGFGGRARSAPDGTGGIYLAWSSGDDAAGSDSIRLVRWDGTGQLAGGWPARGITVTSLTTRKRLCTVTSDGTGGVVVGWVDLHAGPGWKAYVQRVDAGGSALWAAGGVALSSGAGDQFLDGVVPDAAGGAIAIWMDGAGSAWDLDAQRVDAAGTLRWGPSGQPVCSAPGNQYAPAMLADGAGGAIVAWQDDRALPAELIHMERMNSAGVPQWNVDGVVPTLANLVSASIVDGVARIVWSVATHLRVSIERSEDGVSWTARATMLPDGEGRIQFRDADILPAQRYGWRLAIAGSSGAEHVGETWLDVPGGAAFGLRALSPNPVSERLSVAFTLSEPAPARIELLDVAGRRVRVRDLGPLEAGNHVLQLDAANLRPGIYVLRLSQLTSSVSSRFVVTR